jgi:hypothetical protein
MGRRTSGLATTFAKPLAGKPKIVRDTVGWLGLNTIFLATLVWGYRLMLQKPEQPVATKSPIALIAEGGHADEHGTHAKGHGDEPEDAHADPHSDPHAKPDSDTHVAGAAEGEHAHQSASLSGSPALRKKKVTYALSDVMAAKLSGAKKDAGGHGEAKKDAHGAAKKDSHGAAKKSSGGH